jgi:hypothetical protein
MLDRSDANKCQFEIAFELIRDLKRCKKSSQHYKDTYTELINMECKLQSMLGRVKDALSGL